LSRWRHLFGVDIFDPSLDCIYDKRAEICPHDSTQSSPGIYLEVDFEVSKCVCNMGIS